MFRKKVVAFSIYILRKLFLKSQISALILYFFCNLLKRQLSYQQNYQQNSLRRNWTLEQPLGFTGYSSIRFNSPPSPNIVGKAAQSSLSLAAQHKCDLRDAMPLHWSPSILPSQPLPREEEDFLRGGKYPKDVPMLI